MEKLVKAVVSSDKFQELKELLPTIYRLTIDLAKDVEYGSVSPELEERVKKHFQYVWKYLNLPDNASLTGPGAAFMKDMQKNMKAIQSTMNDLRRSNMFGEGKTMKITRTELNDLIGAVIKEQNLSKTNKRKALSEVNKLIHELLKTKQKIELLRPLIQNLETGSFQDEDGMLNSYNIALKTIEQSLYQLNVLKQSLPRG